MTIESITVRSIKIEGLFEIFYYDVNYPANENVLIITGLNGCGKTQILNIIANLFDRKFSFFKGLVFKKVTVYLNNDTSIEIVKDDHSELGDIRVSFFEKAKLIEICGFSFIDEERTLAEIALITGMEEIDINKWLDTGRNDILSREEVIGRYGRLVSPQSNESSITVKTPQANAILDSINVHLIKEQRLFKKVKPDPRRSFKHQSDQTLMIESIQSYADELKELIAQRTQASYKIAQKLDGSYPSRLISEKKKVSEKEYKQKFIDLKAKQDKLVKNGLSESSQKALDYSEDDAKALLVYLNDLEQKSAVFDDLLEKLELFTSILNERRFTFKSINISRDKGFYFKTVTGSELELSQLSSGEQHEVVLLYELIFKTRASILVLIDEPEISLHITWQKEFLADLLKIIKLQNFQVLIATHSPSIINDRWDLVYNLEKLDD